METTGFIIVYITVPTDEEAEKIAGTLLEKRLAACVNIVPGITSHYWWENRQRTSAELLLVVKTRASLFSEIEAVVKETGSYSVPDILALPVVQGSDVSLEWMNKELKEQA